MIAEKVATLYRGGPESDARLHLAVGNPPFAPVCAGQDPREALSITYPYTVDLLGTATGPLWEAVNTLAEQLAIRVIDQAITPEQRDRLCRRCATDLLR